VPWRSAVSGPPVDHQLELARRLDRKIAGIFASQHAIEISAGAPKPVAPGAATKKPIRYLAPIPGAPDRASTKYDVAQAMSFVATHSKNAEERVARQDEIPRLLARLPTFPADQAAQGIG
jgi:hypothetical protein